MELSSSNIKKFLIFSRNKAFLIFREQKSRKNSLYFKRKYKETELSYISGIRNPKKLLTLQKVTFRARKIKKKIFILLIKSP